MEHTSNIMVDVMSNKWVLAGSTLVIGLIFWWFGRAISKAKDKAEEEDRPFDTVALLKSFMDHQIFVLALLSLALMFSETLIITSLVDDGRHPMGVFLFHIVLSIVMFTLGINFPKNILVFGKSTRLFALTWYYRNRIKKFKKEKNKDKTNEFEKKYEELDNPFSVGEYIALILFTILSGWAAWKAPMEILKIMARSYDSYAYLELWLWEWWKSAETIADAYKHPDMATHVLIKKHGVFKTVDEVMHEGMGSSILMIQVHYLLTLAKGCAIIALGHKTMMDDFRESLRKPNINQSITHKEEAKKIVDDEDLRSEFFEKVLKKCGVPEPARSKHLERMIKAFDKFKERKNQNSLVVSLKVRLENIKELDRQNSKNEISKSDYKSKLLKEKNKIKDLLESSSREEKGLSVSIKVK